MVYFQTKNPNLGKILESLSIKDVGKFYDDNLKVKILVIDIWAYVGSSSWLSYSS
jgi:hypothetical protein